MSLVAERARSILRSLKTQNDWKYEVWFEDLHMLGKGDSKLEALDDAGRNTIDILELIVQAKVEITTVSTTAGTVS